MYTIKNRIILQTIWGRGTLNPFGEDWNEFKKFQKSTLKYQRLCRLTNGYRNRHWKIIRPQKQFSFTKHKHSTITKHTTYNKKFQYSRVAVVFGIVRV